MKVKIIYRKSDDEYREGDVTYMEILINDEREFSMGEGEPEDFSFSRDLNDCFNIPQMLEKAYEAGKNGEEFELEEVDE